MNHSEKVQLWMRQAQTEKIRPYAAAPPVFRMLWALGVEIGPPHFLNPLLWFLSCSASYGASLLGIQVVFIWLLGLGPVTDGKLMIGFIPIASLSIAYSAIVTFVTRRKASRLQLPPWEKYPFNNFVS